LRQVTRIGRKNFTKPWAGFLLLGKVMNHRMSEERCALVLERSKGEEDKRYPTTNAVRRREGRVLAPKRRTVIEDWLCGEGGVDAIPLETRHKNFG